MNSIFDWLSSSRGELLLSGVSGSAVSVAMEWSGLGAGLRRLFVGALTAYFMGPVGVPIFQWALGHIDVAEGQSAGVGGFVMGVTGVIIIEIMLKAFRLRSAELGQGHRHDED